MSATPPPDDGALRLGPYRLVRELGRGGQAILWLAEDTRIGRQVALKVLPPLGPRGADALRRFRREAEVASRLAHPGICTVLEADISGGTPYIAMRYVPGETLEQRIVRARDTQAVPPNAAALRTLAVMFEKIARALHLAHEAGIVHRDIKPANLMITPEGEPVILDFGLAREDDEVSQGLSLTGDLSGTPAYMSPEQATGRARPDRRTDVWSLGISLFEAVTQAHPFAAATRETLFQAILVHESPDPRRANPAVDRDLATILAAATAKERDRRYQTALDFAEDLRRWGANEPIRARPVGRMERIVRWAQRQPALAATSAAIAVLGLVAIALVAYGVGAAGRAEREATLRASADSARQTAEQERGRADAARAALEQIDRDRALETALDELNMQAGTLWFGMDAKKTVAVLAPKYVATFRAFGADFESEDVPELVRDLHALQERDSELGSVAQVGLGFMSSTITVAGGPAAKALRDRVDAVLASFPEGTWPELSAAEARWETDQIDEFEPLLTDTVLAAQPSSRLDALASTLLTVPGRLPDADRVLARAVALDPGSFRLHFLSAAVGFMRLQAEGPEAMKGRVAETVHHMQVAVALRPRSGFVRAMMANALAISGRYEESMQCMDIATELEPSNPVVWLFRARYFSYSPWPERGIEACRRALELDPELGDARQLMAELEKMVKKG